MNGRIKVFNATNHVHNVRMLMPNGAYTHRKLAKKDAFALLTEDQFLDLYMTTRDFKGNFLTFNQDDLSDDIKMTLGMPVDKEEEKTFEPEFKIYKDEDILGLIKGKVKPFKDFIKEVQDMDIKNSDELKRRIFDIAVEIESLTRTKSEAIEDLTGKSFKLNDK